MLDTSRPFTVQQAAHAGLSPGRLRASRYRRLFRGVYEEASRPLDLHVWLTAALLVLPADAVVSHTTAMRLYGLTLDDGWPLHVSTSTSTHSRLAGIVTHRRRGALRPVVLDGLPVTGADRTLVDIATKVRLVPLVQAIEHMIHRGHTTPENLLRYAMDRHLDGVRRVRRVMALVRENVESPLETTVRLMIVFARLPEPSCNVDILDESGALLARGDLVYARWKVLVEYDGWHHERDARQRQRDRERREELEASGWRLIVVTSADLRDKREVVRRVHRAISARGYDGRDPHFSVMWDRLFAGKLV
ncbi:DUF559 domain-containing protein [Aeromicrobium sp. Root472D3]|uniref:type IV toxin-antitoxin system AbiEi family antitoxin domain-containing protein n=1 Tax=Aeromicrobium sp. Root472D3 TaxID=1736540 RepID=UPI0006FE688E|nr:DUF559 domain-containing protein [Aeromicrobium sp. Root472D3]KQX74615.1 hypothetical protein ASD10_05130 [Aeromicrobium sp. Root472D3]